MLNKEIFKIFLTEVVWNYLEEFGGVRVDTEREYTHACAWIVFKGYEEVATEDNSVIYRQPVLGIKLLIDDIEKEYDCNLVSEDCISKLLSINPLKTYVCLLDGRVCEYFNHISGERIISDVRGEIEREQEADLSF